MVALKIGAVGAVTALLGTIGAPATVVALTPLLISWTEIAIRQYLEENKKIEKAKKQPKEDISNSYYGSGLQGGAFILPELKGLDSKKVKQLQSKVPQDCYNQVSQLMNEYGIQTKEVTGSGLIGDIKKKIESVVKNSKFWKIVGAFGLLTVCIAMIVLVALITVSTPLDALIFVITLIISSVYTYYNRDNTKIKYDKFK